MDKQNRRGHDLKHEGQGKGEQESFFTMKMQKSADYWQFHAQCKTYHNVEKEHTGISYTKKYIS